MFRILRNGAAGVVLLFGIFLGVLPTYLPRPCRRFDRLALATTVAGWLELGGGMRLTAKIWEGDCSELDGGSRRAL